MANPIDSTVVETLLANTISSNNEARTKLREQPTFYPTLLHIVARADADVNVKKAAAIHLKNSLINRWEKLNEQDQIIIRENIVQVIADSSELVIVKFLAVACRIMGENDFPAKWQSFIPTIINYISTGDLTKITNILFPLRMMVHAFVYRDSKSRVAGEMNELAQTILPVLYTVYQNVRNKCIGEIKTPIIMVQIEKIFADLLNRFDEIFIPHMDVFQNWMNEFKISLDIPIGQYGENIIPSQPEDPEDIEKFSWWKVKKWIINIINKIFSSYGKKGIDKYEEFSKEWVNKYALGFLESCFTIMQLKKEHKLYNEYVMNLALTYTATASQMSVTYRYIKKQLEFLLVDIILGCVRKSDSLMEQFQDDPIEYIRERNDFINDYKSESYAASCLLIDLAKFRGQDVLPPFMQYCSQVLQQCQVVPPEQQDFRLKDAVYQCIGDLSPNLMSKTVYISTIEPLLINFVLPDFRSPYPLLRSTACWLFDVYSSYKFSQDIYYQQIIQELITCLSDDQIPVKIGAAVAVGRIAEENTYSQFFTNESIIHILKVFLQLCLEYGFDNITTAFSAFLDKFDEPIKPHIPEIVQTLLLGFIKFASSQDDEDLSNSIGYCDLLTSLCYKVEKDPLLINHLEQLIIPPLLSFLHPEKFSLELFESIMDIVSFFTYRIEVFPSELWSAFSLVITDLYEIAPDYLSSCSPALENFISRSTAQFIQGKMVLDNKEMSNLDGICTLIFKILKRKDEDCDGCYCCLLLQSILFNCESLRKQVIPIFLTQVVARISESLSKVVFKVMLLEVIETCIGFEPILSIEFLNNLNVLEPIIQEIIKNMQFHTEIEEKMLFVFCFSSIIGIPFASWLPIMNALTNQMVDLRNQQQNEKEKGDEDEEDEEGYEYDDGYEKDDWGYLEDNDAIDKDELKYSKLLESIRLDEGENEKYESLYGFSKRELKGYVEPVTNIKLYGMFAQNFQNNVNLAQYIAPKLNDEAKQVLQGCVDLGKKELMN